MKTLILLFPLISLILIACDAPVRTRVPTSTDYIPSPNQEFDNSSSFSGGSGGEGSSNQNSNGSSTNEAGYENCDLSLQYSGGSLGYFGICQHSSDERRFKATFAQSSTSGTCFIPIYVQSNGNSFKLGIAECVQNQSNTPYYMTLNKEMLPPTFSYPRPEPVNGVMVIAANSVNAYMGCMNAKEDYLVATNGCCYQQVAFNGRSYCLQTNPQCESAATNYTNTVCTSFVQNHSSHYRQVSF